MNKDVIVKFIENVKLLIQENGEKEDAFLTIEIVESINDFINKDDFFNSNIIGKYLTEYISSIMKVKSLKYDDETFDAIYFLWSVIDAYSDEETRGLVTSSITDTDSFSNFKVYIQGMRHNS
ncbi:hypothetical protein ACM9HF_04605 [Colwellia sp. RE-S-Sl-9]